MIRRLYLENCFLHHKKAFDFSPGLTVITGPNESGKSLILEMVRFCLFGIKALRGKADDYRNLYAELDLTLQGEDYRIIRSSKKVQIIHNNAPLASGTTAVNQCVIDLFGYTLPVFDIAHAVNQGEIEALSQMKPSERKSMVDHTIGLTALDDLIVIATEKASLERKAFTVLEKEIVEPVEPIEPERFVSEAELKSAKEQVAEYHKLRGWLSHEPPPVAATDPIRPCNESSEELKHYQNERRRIEAELHKVELALAKIPEAKYTLVEIETFEAHCDRYETQWQALSLKKRLDELREQGEQECPSCHYRWPVAHGDICQLEQELAKFPKHALSEMPPPPHTRTELVGMRRALEAQAEREELTEKVRGLKDRIAEYPDRSVDLDAIRVYERDIISLTEARRLRAEWEARAEQVRTRVEELEPAVVKIDDLERLFNQWQLYENAKQHYEEAQAQNQMRKQVFLEHKWKAQEYGEARNALKNLKTQIKTHLVPSLSRVASKLITEMTGGERSKIEVNEDFEIMVDGQALDTLSGSGKAVANLAVRIGLGQVLTHEKFSFLACDEIDAAMDQQRAGYTAECLRNLKSQIGQIILVTHKRPDGDFYIEV